MLAAVRLLLSTFLLLGMGLAQAQLSNGRYGPAQVFDVQRSPAFPVAFSPFTVSNFANPVQGGSPFRYTLAAGEYVRFVEVSADPCRYSLNIYNGADNFVRTVHASGTVYGLGPLGFLHVSDPGDFGTFVANSSGYAIGDSLTYVPLTGAATCADTASYQGNPTPIDSPSPKFTVGGSISNVTAPGLVLSLNGGSLLPRNPGDTSFAFPGVADGTPYFVGVAQEPVGQACGIANPSGTVNGADVTNIGINCVYTVRFSVSGLQASSIVQVSDGSTPYGSYRNGSHLITKNQGEAYDINVPVNPPGHVCTVSGPASGSIDGAGVDGILISCVPNPYSIGGSPTTSLGDPAGIVGLAPGSTVRLRLDYTAAVDPCIASLEALTCKVTADGSEEKDFSANGSFSFDTALNIGDGFTVSVAAAGNPGAPAAQTCTVTSTAIGKGNAQPPATGIVGASDVDYLRVECTPDYYSVGGTVTGLAPGNEVVLQNNGGDSLTVSGNTGFTFPTALPDGAGYAVTVLTQPTTPNQTCTVGRQIPSKGDPANSGVIAGFNVNNLLVTCTTNTYTVGGTVSGLAPGNEVVLQNNGGDDLTVSTNGGFTFPTALADGSSFAVTVLTQPTSPNQTCSLSLQQINAEKGSVAPGSGVIMGGNVSFIQVICSTETYTVGGTVSGLAAGNSVVLQNNGGDTLTVSANGGFTFPTALADGSSYAVTVLTQPTSPNQTCTVSRQLDTKGNGANSGVIAGSNVSNLLVSCTTNTYTIGVSVSGLAGTGLVLRNNGADDLAITGNGDFSFATALADGSSYAVSVAIQPSNPAQTCTLAQFSKGGPGSGVINGANVTGIAVSCANDATAPGAPTNVQLAFNGNQATVSWTPPADDGGSPITGYTVVLQPGGLGCTVTGSPPPTSCQVSGVQPGQTYTVSVVASNGAGAGAPGTGSGGATLSAPVLVPVDAPWALALLGLLVALVGGRGLLARR